MKRLLLSPLLFTLLVGCSNTDKTFRERRDDCADLYAGAITYGEISQKYNFNKTTPFDVMDKDRYNKYSFFSERAIVNNFCRFYIYKGD